jgi:quinol monooxygenase YgiN
VADLIDGGRFADQKAVEVHQSSEAFKGMLAKAAELGLLIKEPEIKVLESVAGFGFRG